jgi:galactokinase
MPDKIFRRSQHVVLENKRVLDAADALTNGDFHLLGRLMYQSHYSLQNDYEVSCKELDFLVQLTENKKYILGSRMMGGGFGGCTINIIEKAQATNFIELAAKNYKNQFGIDVTPYTISIENGASLVK